MSLPVSVTYQQHSKDAVEQCYDHLDADFFDTYLTFDAVDNEARNCEVELFESSSSLDEEPLNQDQWQPEPWEDLLQPFATEGYHFYSESSGRAAISDTELLSLEGITLQTPEPKAQFQSLPSSPLQQHVAAQQSRTSRLANSLTRKIKTSARELEKSIRSPIRKSSSSPRKPQQSWDQKLHSTKFELDLEELSQPLSPEHAKLPKTPSNTSINPVAIKQEQCDVVYSSTNGNGWNTKADTGAQQNPLSTPALDSGSSRTTGSYQRTQNAMITPQYAQQSNEWCQVSNSSEVNHYSNDSTAIWWNHASAAPMAQPLPTALHVNPQRATKSLALQLQNGLSYSENEFMSPLQNGLANPADSSASQQPFIVQSPPRQQAYYATPPSNYHARPRYSSHSRSKSYPTNETMRQKLPSSESESPSPPSLHARKRKSLKLSRNSTPRTASLGSAVDFVNYTPNDSKKILTGVAPSGSSKTKARREREAMEKRRKLSQAAVRAVRAAGGDVESLVEQGLFC